MFKHLLGSPKNHVVDSLIDQWVPPAWLAASELGKIRNPKFLIVIEPSGGGFVSQFYLIS